jgi:hypothetical protein
MRVSSAAATEPVNGATLGGEPPRRQPAEPTSRRILVETTGRSAWLERNEPAWDGSGWHLVWRPICESPCAIEVPATGLYRVSGPGVQTSAKFRLPESRDAIRIRVDPGSSSAWGWGLAGIITGGVIAGSSALLFIDDPACEASGKPDCEKVRTQAAVFSLALGAVLGLGGLYLLFANGTDVSLNASAPRPIGRAVPWPGVTFTPQGVAF